MLNVVFYNSNQELIDNIQNEHKASLGQTVVVCPSPLVADNLRSLAPELEVVTISKWGSDHLRKSKLKRVKKSELLIKLAPVWKVYFPEGKFSKFMEAFELFTELRSFTLEIGLLAEFSSHLDEEMQKSIKIFWAYLMSEELIDEQLSYQKIAEILSKAPSEKICYFVGFKHLGGIQIDMLKQIGELSEVNVAFPQNVYQETLPNDWIRWITGDGEIKDSPEIEIISLKKLSLPKGKTNLFLEHLSKTQNSSDILFSGTQVDLINYQEAYKADTFFKTKEDIFSIVCEDIFSTYQLDFENKIFPDFNALNEKINKDIEIFISSGLYRQLKIVQTLKSLIPIYQEMNEKLDEFALNTLFSVTLLNLPRTSLVTLGKELDRQFLSISDLSFRDETRSLMVLATEAIGGFRSNEKVLAEEMSKALKVLGPIKRTGLDYTFHKYEIISALRNPKTILAIEDKLIETETAWREILKCFYLEEIELDVDFKLKKVRDLFKDEIKKEKRNYSSYSATRLQTYYDCPRKFYYHHLEPFDNRPDSRSLIGADELGRIEHDTIKHYFERKKETSEINFKLLKEITDENFARFLENKKIEITSTEKTRALSEIFQFSQNGIMFLNDIISEIAFKSISFEVELPPNPWKLKGSIDCLIEDESGAFVLLDFKRSSGSIGSKKETQELHKLQLWIYLLCLKNAQKNVSQFGYVNLSDADLKEVYFDSQFAQSFYDSKENEIKEKIENLIAKLNNDTVFEVNPRNEKACAFCSVRLFCHKGDIDATN